MENGKIQSEPRLWNKNVDNDSLSWNVNNTGQKIFNKSQRSPAAIKHAWIKWDVDNSISD